MINRQQLELTKGHVDEKKLLEHIETSFFEIAEYEENHEAEEWDASKIREAAIDGHPLITEAFYEMLQESFDQRIREYGEIEVDVSYDLYGMAHSGSNAIYEFLGDFYLRGSDYNEGPTNNIFELLNYLSLDDDRLEVYISDEVKEMISKRYKDN